MNVPVPVPVDLSLSLSLFRPSSGRSTGTGTFTGRGVAPQAFAVWYSPGPKNMTDQPENSGESILGELRRSLAAGVTREELLNLRVLHLGKKSPLRQELRQLGALPADQRAARATRLNQLQAEVEAAIAKAEEELANAELMSPAEWLDGTLPGTVPPRGSRHPLTEVVEKCLEVTREFGFELAEGPEIEEAYFNFDALNIDEHHPARDMQDTFWLPGGRVLRTHTTTVQARVLKGHPPLPVRIASPGRAYRNEAVDATHLAMFHQFEGLWVDRGLVFPHLMGLLSEIARRVYGGAAKFRFKPKYYPYTEPSLGMDLACTACDGAGCAACHDAGWLTVLGAGMVHPEVLREFNYDPSEVGGIAFGLGISRIASQASGVEHIKRLYEQDLRVFAAVRRGGL